MTDKTDEDRMVAMHQLGVRDYRTGAAMSTLEDLTARVADASGYITFCVSYVAGYRGAERRDTAARRAARVAATLLGSRVELSPSTDWWMKGARFGTIVKAGKTYMRVKLDANDKVVRVHGDLLQPIGE
jgi:hypothetical protein